jgi:hypothetical protein
MLSVQSTEKLYFRYIRKKPTPVRGIQGGNLTCVYTVGCVGEGTNFSGFPHFQGYGLHTTDLITIIS